VTGSSVVIPHLALPWYARRNDPLLSGWRPEEPADTEVMWALAQRAVDAAMHAGATYADVRLTHTLTEAYGRGEFAVTSRQRLVPSVSPFPRLGQNIITFGGTGNSLAEFPQQVFGIPTLVIGIGVRALVQGYWGFASSPVWTDAEAVRLGQKATLQAAQNAHAGEPRAVELGTVPIVRRGRWVQPGIDPFSVPIDEKLDVLRTMLELPAQGDRFAKVVNWGARLWREERVFASSEGASYSQVRYRCFPSGIQVSIQGDEQRGERYQSSASWKSDVLTAHGWETFQDLDVDSLAEHLLAQALQARDLEELPVKPVEIGKYDVVFDAPVTAHLVYHTLGVATELDRAMGYEANAGGTSYLGPDPFQYLGTEVASPLISVTADRTTPHALATAKWDDEGMPCGRFPLIERGILVDYQTTREQAAWLSTWYTKHGMPLQSHACAASETALECPIQMSPNVLLTPGREAIGVEDLIKDTARGVYVPIASASVDQQVRNGFVQSQSVREIRNGKLGAVLKGAGVLFRSLDFWKNVTALGGGQSAQFMQAGESKGEPTQQGLCNVQAVPMKVTGCAVIDVTRKA
jgi:TldD protein